MARSWPPCGKSPTGGRQRRAPIFRKRQCPNKSTSPTQDPATPDLPPPSHWPDGDDASWCLRRSAWGLGPAPAILECLAQVFQRRPRHNLSSVTDGERPMLSSAPLAVTSVAVGIDNANARRRLVMAIASSS